jgi:surface carbohydrate biosynthesis protein (TIGR04326 family)
LTGQSRRKLIQQYVGAIRRLGSLPIDGETVRSRMTVGNVDFWAASTLRESSPWTSNLFDRLDSLQPEPKRRTQPPTRTSWNVGAFTLLRSFAYLALATATSLRNRRESVSGDVLFVVFMPASAKPVSDRELLARYYGGLPDHLRTMGIRPAVLFLPTDSVPSTMSGAERRTRRSMQRELASMTTTSHLTPRAVWCAMRTWMSMRRRAPRVRDVIGECANDPELSTLSEFICPDLERSIRGTASVRVALLAETFKSAVRSAREVRAVIYPFEGQGWESLLEAACRENSIPTVAYLHTIMKPWDLRAHTALSEAPPQLLAMHGPHDRSELLGVSCKTVDVEALRYEYLANLPEPRSAIGPTDELLVVLGSDCATSSRQLGELINAIQHRQLRWRIRVKQHPQCQLPPEANGLEIETNSLGKSLESSSAVFLCGTAAPLDSYLFGLPTAAIQNANEYSMNPLQPDDLFHVGESADDALGWLANASSQRHLRPDAAHYFDLLPGYQKWQRVIDSIIT